jgi:hypothetical protein
VIEKPNHSIISKDGSKSVFSEYVNFKNADTAWITNEGIEKIGLELVEWAVNNEDALKIMPFFRERGISTTTVSNWRQKSKLFNEQYEEVKCIIGDRREIGMLKNKYNATGVIRSMPFYDREWKEGEEWRARLNKDDNQQNQIKMVVIEKFPEMLPVTSENQE